MQYLSAVYLVNQPLHVSGIFVAHHQEVHYIYIYIQQLIKSEAVPLQAWSGPEGSRKLRFPDFMTTTQGVGKVVKP